MQRVPGLGFTAAILFVCYLLCSCTGDGEGPERRVSVVRRGPWQHEVVEGVHPEAAITATFTNQINKNGSVVRIRLKFLLQVYKQHVLTRFLGFCLLLCTRKDWLSCQWQNVSIYKLYQGLATYIHHFLKCSLRVKIVLICLIPILKWIFPVRLLPFHLLLFCLLRPKVAFHIALWASSCIMNTSVAVCSFWITSKTWLTCTSWYTQLQLLVQTKQVIAQDVTLTSLWCPNIIFLRARQNATFWSEVDAMGVGKQVQFFRSAWFKV